MTEVNSTLNSSNHLVSSGRFDSHRVYSGGTDDIKNEAMLYSYQPISDDTKAEKDDFTEIFENAVPLTKWQQKSLRS